MYHCLLRDLVKAAEVAFPNWPSFLLPLLVKAYEYDTGNPEDDALTRKLINELVS